MKERAPSLERRVAGDSSMLIDEVLASPP